MNLFGVKTAFDESNLNYSASVSSVLVQNGLFGILVLLFFVLLLFKQNKKIFSFLILFIALLCFEDVLFNFRFGFYISIMFSINAEYEMLNAKWNKKKRGATYSFNGCDGNVL
jgi:hypothetical protein